MIHQAGGNLIVKILILIFIGLSLPNQLQAKDTITWVTEHFEPYYINSGPLANQGIGDRINQALIDELPEYDHVTQYMPILRITSALKNGEKISVTTYLKNPKDKEFAQYSITSLVVPPLELTMRMDDWENQWQQANPISLIKLLKNDYLIGIAGRRYYGDNLSPILYDTETYPNGTYNVQSTHYRSLADMVSRGRIDATIGYAAELKYYQHISTETEKLVSVPIIENPDILYAYVVMPKNEWGYMLKMKIDKVLHRIRNTVEYQSIMYDWFGKTPKLEEAITTRFSSND